jgi:uroporphyrinogen decarboxylase
MTERERFVRTLTGTGPDRPSYGDYFAYEATQQRWEREGLPAGLDRDGLFRHFGFDHIDVWATDRLYVHNGVLPPFADEVLEETAECVVRRIGSGDVVKVLKDEPPPAMPQFLAHPVRDRATWATFRQRLDPDTPGRLPADLAEIARQSPGRTTPLGAWLGGTFGYIRNWLGVENASLAFYDDPGLVDEMVAHLTHLHVSLAERIFAAGVELDWVMFWEDMAYNHASLISPALYRRHCLPFYRAMVPLVRRHGVRALGMDSDGNVEELIPLWLDEGIPVMHPMEVAAGMDVRTTRRRYGRNVTFLGGIDKRALAKGRQAIDAEVVPKVRELRDTGGGFVVQCDHGVPPDISLDNFRYYRDRVRDLSEGRS